MIQFIQKRPLLSWFSIGLLIYVPFLGSSHLFDWDEVNFAESAREMIVSGNYLSVQINFEPFWEKPPLFIWMQVLSFQIFGIFTDQAIASMEFAARFPNTIVGALTLVTLFLIGRKHFSAQFGHLWAFSYLAALTPHLYASSGIIDPLFNLFIFLGIYFFIRFKASPKEFIWVLLSGFAIGLGMLTKGPVALLLWGLTIFVYAIYHRKLLTNFWHLAKGASAIAFISLLLFISWYGLIAYQHGFGIINDFFQYQIRLLTTGDAGHGQPFYYHFFVLLLGCFPISIWAGARVFRRKKTLYVFDEVQTDFSQWIKILFWVVLILFSIVKTKIIHYSSMCWIPLSFFSAEVLFEWQKDFWIWKKSYTIFTLIVGGIFALVLVLVPFIGLNSAWFSLQIQDVFVKGNLEAPVYWSGYEMLIGILFFVFLIVLFSIRGTVKLARIYLLMCVSIGLIIAMTQVILPKVEGYTQRAAIDFYESKVGQKVLIETLGFKSFAHLLYFQKPGKSSSGKDLLENGAGNTPVYFVLKSDAENQFRYHPKLIFIKEENGFMFYKRK
jgi:4-amino-4-deoxy-L-arabinose transferase-like glycosyltransferase